MARENTSGGENPASAARTSNGVHAARTFTFQSKYLAHRIHLRHPRRGLDNLGAVVIVDHGLVVQFEQGRYTTSDPTIADDLRRCPAFGTDFWELNTAKIAQASSSASAPAA